LALLQPVLSVSQEYKGQGQVGRDTGKEGRDSEAKTSDAPLDYKQLRERKLVASSHPAHPAHPCPSDRKHRNSMQKQSKPTPISQRLSPLQSTIISEALLYSPLVPCSPSTMHPSYTMTVISILRSPKSKQRKESKRGKARCWKAITPPQHHKAASPRSCSW
jgi:hypothetical protein